MHTATNAKTFNTYDADVVVFELVDHGQGFRREHRIDASDLVADLPAGFKNIIGLDVLE